MASLKNLEKGRSVDSVVAELLNIADRERGVDLSRYDVRAMVANSNVEGLVEMLRDKDWRERVRAIRGLTSVGDARVIEPLIRGLMDEEEPVRQAATLALSALEKKMERMYYAR